MAEGLQDSLTNNVNNNEEDCENKDEDEKEQL